MSNFDLNLSKNESIYREIEKSTPGSLRGINRQNKLKMSDNEIESF